MQANTKIFSKHYSGLEDASNIMRVISLKNYCESTRVVIQLLQYQNKVMVIMMLVRMSMIMVIMLMIILMLIMWTRLTYLTSLGGTGVGTTKRSVSTRSSMDFWLRYSKINNLLFNAFQNY